MAFYISPLEYDQEYFPEEMAIPTPTPLVYIPTMQPIIYQHGRPPSAHLPAEEGRDLSYGGYGGDSISVDPWLEMDATVCGHAIPIMGALPISPVDIMNGWQSPYSPPPPSPNLQYIPRSPSSFDSPGSTPSPSPHIEPLPSPLLSTGRTPPIRSHSSPTLPIYDPQSPIDEMETLFLQDDYPISIGLKRRSDHLLLDDDKEPDVIPSYIDTLCPLPFRLPLPLPSSRKRRRMHYSHRNHMFPFRDDPHDEPDYVPDAIMGYRRRPRPTQYLLSGSEYDIKHAPDVIMME